MTESKHGPGEVRLEDGDGNTETRQFTGEVRLDGLIADGWTVVSDDP